MLGRLIWNDVRRNKLVSFATLFFMTIAAALLALAAMLFACLLGAIDELMDEAQVPDVIQMHAGSVDEDELAAFVETHPEIEQWQVARFLNLDNGRLALDGQSLRDSTQDNGLSTQGESFDFLLGMDGGHPDVLPGEVHVPVAYRDMYDLAVGDSMTFDGQTLTIAGFIRDAQMNSMMASSKRFLVSEEDYVRLAGRGEEELIIEFALRDGADANALQTDYAALGLPSNGPSITRPLVRVMNALSDGMMIFVILLVGVITALISLLCIRFILSLQMERDRRELGLLKALGISARDIRRIFFSKYLVFSACGAALGLALAALLHVPLAEQLEDLYGANAWSWQALAASLVAVLLAEGVILSSMLLFMRKQGRITALEALFQPASPRRGAGRYALIGFVTAACAMLLLVPQSLSNTIASPQFVTYMGIGDADMRLDVRQSADLQGATARIARALEHDEQVEAFTVLQTSSHAAVLPNGDATRLAVETGDHTVFPVSYVAGQAPDAPREIALSSLNAEELGVAIGDELLLFVDGTEIPYDVCGIYSDITNGGKTAKALVVEGGVPVIWSVVYATLANGADEAAWAERYRQMGADVTDIADYVQATYAQTLAQLRLAAWLAAAIAALVIAVVLGLFLRLIIEQDRHAVSLRKALGLTNAKLKRLYLLNGLVPVLAGTALGLFFGIVAGEAACGTALQSFGAEGFRFAIDWGQVSLGLALCVLAPAVLAMATSVASIEGIKAFECCRGRE